MKEKVYKIQDSIWKVFTMYRNIDKLTKKFSWYIYV